MVATAPSDAAGGFRPDIQGLRAIAVLLVLVYHLWPGALPGGYVGVDVFFVISGYLITSLLLKDLATSGSISFARFYVRRARRLLPASLVTLVVILLAAYAFLPPLQWRDTAEEVAASALYVENWRLAAESVDYLSLDSVPSAVQHFWSLSVEEQFYLGWPLLLFLVHLGARSLPARFDFRRTCAAALLIVVAASLAWSVYLGLSGSSTAYFSTFTRVWQLGSGGLLAVLAARPGRIALPALIAGLLLIAASAVVLKEATAYPGYAAILPTGGALLALHGGPAWRRSLLTRWLALRPVQFIGDISYSLYLWHWPIIAIHSYRTGTSPSMRDAVIMLALSIAVAAISKRFVEDPFRGPRRRGNRTVLATAAVATAGCVAVAFALHGAAERHRLAPLGASSYPGAAALRGASVPDVGAAFIPALVDVESDVASAYDEGCIQKLPRTPVRTCVYGPMHAKVRIALIGDSHAVHWIPAFQALIDRMELQLVAITKTSCAFSLSPVYHYKLKRDYTECLEWTRNVIAYLGKERFDRVLIAQSPMHGVAGKEPEESIRPLAVGVRQALDTAARTGNRIAVLRATPWQKRSPRDCVAVEAPPFEACAASRTEALPEEALSVAARAGGYPVLDFTDLFCPDDLCPPIIGNVFVYRDVHHVTATYMRTLAPMLAERLGLSPISPVQ